MTAGGVTSIDTGGVTSIDTGGVTSIDTGGVTSIDTGGVTSIDTGGVTSIDTGGVTSIDTGGVTSIRHNEVRDFTATLLKEVCYNVQVEPQLQPLTGESFSHKTANTDPCARLDISACGVWGGRFERTFFDVRVFNPSAQSNCATPISSTYRKHENEKRRHYEERILQVERASFSPLVLSATGGMAPVATTFYCRIASMLSEKQHTPYSKTMQWIRCKLSFGLLRSTILCIRGSRSTYRSRNQGPLNVHLEASDMHV